MRCCCSSALAFSGFCRSEEASKIVQREVNATSSANSRMTSPYRRTIGRFTAQPSLADLFEFDAADQLARVRFRAQRMVEQRTAAGRRQRRSAHARDVLAAVQLDAGRQLVGDALKERYQPGG